MIVLEVVFLILFWTWVGAALLFLRNTWLPKAPVVVTPTLGGVLETVSFPATDGVRLEGWKIPTEAHRPWIILCHGLGANRSDLLEIAAGLHQARFNLLLFDFRGHGGSGGLTTSFGWKEQRDLEGALAFLGRQAEIPPRPYGVYGISMGASVALLVAAKDERIGVVAADSPYITLKDTLERHLSLLYPWAPKVPFGWFILSTYRLRFGVWPGDVSPLEGAARLGSRPLLLINGAEDIRMTAEETRAIFAAASGPKELWLVEGAGHLESFALGPQRYLSRLVAFFERYLIPS